MFNVGTPELLVILLVALLVLGPTKLPDAARKMGRAMSEARRMTSGFEREMRSAMREAEHSDKEPPTDGSGSAARPTPSPD